MNLVNLLFQNKKVYSDNKLFFYKQYNNMVKSKISTKVKSKNSIKIKPKNSIKVKSKNSSKVKPKSSIKVKSKEKENSSLLMKLINNPINTSIITSLGGLGTFAVKHIISDYGEYALQGYTKELKRFNKHDYKELKSLFNNLTFKYYMDSGLQFARENYRLDKEKIKEYNEAFPKRPILSFQDYVRNNGKDYDINKQKYIIQATRSPPEILTPSMENLPDIK